MSITAASVIPGSDAVIENRTFGATITAGACCYRDSSSLMQLADADGAAALRIATHIALTDGANGQPGRFQKIVNGTTITIGGTMTLGIVYCLGDDPGAIQPAADVASGDYLQVIGIPQSTTVMKLSGLASGVAT